MNKKVLCEREREKEDLAIKWYVLAELDCREDAPSDHYGPHSLLLMSVLVG